jgi:hypothetical protein
LTEVGRIAYRSSIFLSSYNSALWHRWSRQYVIELAQMRSALRSKSPVSLSWLNQTGRRWRSVDLHCGCGYFLDSKHYPHPSGYTQSRRRFRVSQRLGVSLRLRLAFRVASKELILTPECSIVHWLLQVSRYVLIAVVQTPTLHHISGTASRRRAPLRPTIDFWINVESIPARSCFPSSLTFSASATQVIEVVPSLTAFSEMVP